MRKITLMVACAALALSACGSMGWTGGPSEADRLAEVRAALAEPPRTDEDRARDAVRMTAETVAFARVGPGDRVIDLMIGGGFFTRAFSAAVGPDGQVIAWQPDEFVAFSADYGAALAAADALPNVTGVGSAIGAPQWPTGVDVIFTAQNYHDLHLDAFPEGTAARVNAAAFEALRPGGYYVIIDHAAVAGADASVADSLHRIDRDRVVREVTAAGFVLDGRSDALMRAADPMTANVFEPSIRGQTSQFMLRFRKPG
ncbi:class I SAM-dependent methyltransferase [Brevundimonas sp.]|uniref:class I SAM-dependent methyltransferase n=1 Tax=Brevundimonas sp. TaxID=1871086 RepID=UPI003AF42BEF